MKGILLSISTLLIFSTCEIFDDGGLRDNIGNINYYEDTTAFDQFVIIELEKNDVYYNFDQSVSITFSDVSQDSRCPLDVVCVTEGSVSVKITVHDDNMEVFNSTLTLPGKNNYFIYKNTYVRLLNVEPYPEHADIPINKYTITLEVRPVGSDCQSAIIDPDLFDNPWNDEFFFEDVKIVDGTIRTKIKYGGGCGGIKYEMVSDGHLLLTDPPQINVLLSFKDEDDCEAIVSNTLCFDLRIFKVDPTGGTIQINLKDWDTPLNYEY